MTQKPVPAVDALGQAAQATQAQVQANAQAIGNAMTDMWKTMSGLSLPMDAMAKLQGDYISQATAMWNNTLTAFQKEGTPAAPVGDKRFSADAWAKNPAAVSYTHLTLPTNREV